MAVALKRRLGLGLLTAYGVGVMVGAGIYVLIGAVAGQAGVWAPLAFALAAGVALPSALSYAELSARIPEAAGEAAYVEQALGLGWLALLVGLAIVVAGTVSAAAVLRGGVGYLVSVVPVGTAAAILAIGGLLTLVALWGVLESLSVAAILTVIEVGGLLLVVWAGLGADPSPDWVAPAAPVWGGIASAVVLAFFAFIGFEDMVNMAEEVRDPERILPRGLLIAVGITTLLYALVSFAAVRAVPLAALAASDRPLALVWETGTGRSAAFLSLIAVAAALNGILAQIVMAARLLFGLGRRHAAFVPFRQVHPRLGTPVAATLLIGVLVIGTALALPVALLAEFTATILLSVFAVVNISLISLKKRQPAAPFRVPAFVPWIGLVAAVAALFAAIGGWG